MKHILLLSLSTAFLVSCNSGTTLSNTAIPLANQYVVNIGDNKNLISITNIVLSNKQQTILLGFTITGATSPITVNFSLNNGVLSQNSCALNEANNYLCNITLTSDGSSSYNIIPSIDSIAYPPIKISTIVPTVAPFSLPLGTYRQTYDGIISFTPDYSGNPANCTFESGSYNQIGIITESGTFACIDDQVYGKECVFTPQSQNRPLSYTFPSNSESSSFENYFNASWVNNSLTLSSNIIGCPYYMLQNATYKFVSSSTNIPNGYVLVPNNVGNKFTETRSKLKNFWF
jgi:hypothetical protein